MHIAVTFKTFIMKKLLTIMFVASLALAATSCKKDYTCECTVGGQTISAPIANASKGDAEDACTSIETTYKVASATATCTLK